MRSGNKMKLKAKTARARYRAWEDVQIQVTGLGAVAVESYGYRVIDLHGRVAALGAGVPPAAAKKTGPRPLLPPGGLLAPKPGDYALHVRVSVRGRVEHFRVGLKVVSGGRLKAPAVAAEKTLA